ncbi:ATP-dependent helicase [Oxyplasma meridianum]|uniref:ATP-dependent helicase n=1 Tax=Oxyplasma meridianum TaxID=3073602 RepID=A0AAX4NG92_9ARCH
MEETDVVNFRVEDQLKFLDPIIAKWFNSKYEGLTEPQSKAIPLIHLKKNVLVSSPTGTGKTMTGFLAILNELFLMSREDKLEDKIYCLYISPLKALANDITKNLNNPLNEIYELAKDQDVHLPKIRVAVRSGDTSQGDRQKMLRKPPHILITTPESFSLALSAPKFREKFKDLKYVILDEIHEISATKRGSLLSVNLERLESVVASPFVRIGLSATQAPLDKIATYLCGYTGDKPREFSIIDVDTKRFLDLSTITPVNDLTRTSYEVANDRMYDILVKLINEHKTTLVFTNTRSGTEHVAMRLKARGIDEIEAHHSSLGKETRLDVEQKLKNGELKCVITSTSLELGIDIGYIDLVVQIGSPKSVSKGLQRIGRSGHSINELSKGRFLIFELDDLVETSVLTKAAYDREIDKVVIPENSLDVLSQILVGMSLEKVWKLEESYNLVRQSYSFHTLPWEDFMATIDYLAGKIEDSTIYSKIWVDDQERTFGKKKSSRMIYFMNVGTIPEEADYQVISERGRNLGQLSDKFVERLRQGDVFVLGAKTYMYVRSSKNRVYVKEATGMRPTVPSWTGEMLPRSYDLGVLIGKFRKEMVARIKTGIDQTSWLKENYHVDQFGANSIISYIDSQSKFTVPTDDNLFIEGYIDKENLYSIIFHIPLGRRINDALSRSYAQAISAKYSVNTRITVTDDGFMITTEKKIPISIVPRLITENNFEEIVRRSIANTEVFKQRFRHCAARSLMVLRKYKGYDISVVRQQLRSDKVLKLLGQMDNFPVIKETYHEIMNDMMDVPHAKEYIKNVIEAGRYRIRDYSAETSPFSYGLILAGVSDMVLMEDRTKLLKELQSKILDKIYGEKDIHFIFNDMKLVESYFSAKTPRISDEETYMDFASHFLYFDPFRNRVNSPFPYADTAVTDISDKLIQEDRIVSAYVRGVQWINRDYYKFFRDHFRREIELDQVDKKVLDHCNEKTFNEIKHHLAISDEMLKNSLNRLEQAYLVRRKNRSGISTYIINDLENTGPLTMEEAILKIIGSFGPLTMDEILIKLPLTEDEIKNSLQPQVDSGLVVYDYITPVFSKQYMIKSDLENILGTSTENPLKDRIMAITGTVDSTEEYFQRYGYALNADNIRSRFSGFMDSDLDDLLKTKKILYIKAIKNRLCYISRWLMESLHSLRHDDGGKQENEIYNLIREGYGKESDLVQRTSLDTRSIRQVLRNLEFKLCISKGPENRYYPVMGLEPVVEKHEALQRIIDAYGPISTREISHWFWFYPGDTLKGLNLKPVYFKNDLYYGGSGRSNGQNAVILNINDPASIYFEKIYMREADFNSRFILRGEEIATFFMDKGDSAIWISNLILNREDVKDEILEYFSVNSKRLEANAIVVENCKPAFSSLSNGHGFRWVDNNLCFGNMQISELTASDLFRIVINRSSQRKKSDRLTYQFLKDQILGFRTDIESSYAGIRNTEIQNYFQSNLIFTFNGPFGSPALAPIETVSLYRAIRNAELTEQDQRVLKSVMEIGPASESEIISYLRRDFYGIREVLKSLFSKNLVARDSSRKYVYVPEKYRRDDALTIFLNALLKNFGYFSRGLLEDMLQFKIDSQFSDIISAMEKSGKISQLLMATERRLIYIPRNFSVNSANDSLSRIISPKDYMALFFKQYLKSTFGSSGLYYYYTEGGIKAAFSVKKTGRSLTVGKIIGDRSYRDEIKKEFNNLGYAVSFP